MRILASIARSALVALALAAAPMAANANAIGVDAGWYGFCFSGSGSPATAGCQNQGVGVSGNSTTFNALTSVLFQITDAFNPGDTFDVWVDGSLAFTTNAVAADGGVSEANPDLAFANALFSHGQILLAAGFHTIDVFANASPFNGGGAYLQVITSVPEPATLLLFGIGALGLGLARRSRAS